MLRSRQAAASRWTSPLLARKKSDQARENKRRPETASMDSALNAKTRLQEVAALLTDLADRFDAIGLLPHIVTILRAEAAYSQRVADTL